MLSDFEYASHGGARVYLGNRYPSLIIVPPTWSQAPFLAGPVNSAHEEVVRTTRTGATVRVMPIVATAVSSIAIVERQLGRFGGEKALAAQPA